MKPQVKTAAQLGGVAVLMASLSFAAVPFYDWFCRISGFGGTTVRASVAPAEPLERKVLVRFDASLGAGMPWKFKPMQTQMEVRIGETVLAFYEASNPTEHTLAGTASYNVAPFSVGNYFAKIDCFCFQQQILGPGETALMPVTFFIDPEMVNDREAKFVHELTLSYTFHSTDLPEDHAAVQLPVRGTVAN